MHWLALAGAVLAIAYYRVGSMSVWVSVLTVALKVVLIVVVVVAVVAALMFLRRRSTQSRRS
jgi:membrane protein DedA with SNARE-associated domain